MAYIVIKTIKGRQYRYQQRTYRQGGKVRTETLYLGPVDGGQGRKGVLRRVNDFLKANFPPRHGLLDEETMLRRCNEKVERDRKPRERAINHMHNLYGLKMTATSPAMPGDIQGKAPSEEGTDEANTPMPASK